MAPVDAVRPPKKRRPSSRPQPKRAQPADEDTKPSTPPKLASTHQRQRERLVWIIAGSITGVIAILWLLLYTSGAIDTASNTNSGIFGKIDTAFSELWETARDDWLKLERNITTEPTRQPTEEEIHQLEEKVFPQFEDPTRQ